MKLDADRWLAQIFGYPVFRADLRDSDGLTTSELLEAAHGHSAFIYAKVPTTGIDQVRALSAAGFYVIDVNMTFERSPARLLAGSGTRLIRVREIRPDEHAAVLDIAATCFVYSRFHLDPLIPNDWANLIKREWINSYCHQQRGEQLLIAERDDRPIGFLAVLAAGVQGKTARVIDLIGVDKSQQGRGTGRALVEFFIHDSVGRADSLRVGTQAANLPSIRLYEKCGFQLAETTYVLHAHIRNGEVVR